MKVKNNGKMTQKHKLNNDSKPKLHGNIKKKKRKQENKNKNKKRKQPRRIAEAEFSTRMYSGLVITLLNPL